MKRWNQFNFEQRKIVASMLSQPNVKLVEIAKWLKYDPTSISKEIKRNRFVSNPATKSMTKVCSHILRYPYCCNRCKLKYTQCTMKQYRYEAKSANAMAKHRLVSTRVGINMTEDEFKLLDTTIKNGAYIFYFYQIAINTKYTYNLILYYHKVLSTLLNSLISSLVYPF